MLVALSLGSRCSYGQATTGTLVGTVVDNTGAAIANTQITVVNQATQVSFTKTANGTGEYRLTDLPAGLYKISATSQGFAVSSVKDFRIDANKSSTLTTTLSPASSTTTVEVSAEAKVALDTTTIQLQTTFTPLESQDLPSSSIGALGVLNLALLSPGVASGGAIGAGTGPSVGGQRTRNNNYTIEGIDNNDQTVAGPSTNVPNDAVENFTLLTSQFSPEFGHSSGGQFNTTVVSGTNKFHGRLYEYFDNRNLNAVDQTTKLANNFGPAPRYDFNRFGGQIGGPVLHDRLFFFSNFEKQQTGQSLSRAACSPTAAGYATLGTLPGLSQNNLAQLQKYLPAGTVPDTTGACPKSETVTVAGTAVPVALYQFSAPVFSNVYDSINSIDYTVNQRNSFRFRYIYNSLAAQDTSAQLSAFFQPTPQKNHFFSGSYFHTFSPNLANEFRVGFNRFSSITPSGNFSFPGLDSFPNLTFSEINVQVGPDPNAPQFSIQNLYQVTDNINYTHGKHTLVFGFDGRKYISPSQFTQRARGDYEYSTLNLYLLDQSPNQLGERSTGNFNYYGDQTALYGYANDIYRFTPKLTLNLGLRYEFTSTPAGVRNQQLNSLASVPGLINFNSPQPQYRNFAPRVGFAYAPGNGQTSIRAGFGISYDVLFNNLGTLSLPPQFSATQDVPSLTVQTPNFLAGGGLPPGTGGLRTFPTIAAQRAATSAFVPNQFLPYSETYNVSIQHVFAENYTAEIRYLGTRGIHLPAQIQLNRQAEVTAANTLPVFAQSAVPSTSGLTNTLAAIRGPASAPGQFLGQFVPAYRTGGFGPQSTTDTLAYSNITSYQPFGSSNYNGLALQLTRRFSQGLLINSSYTYSKNLDNSTAEVFSTTLSPRRPQDFQNINNDYSVSALDHRHRFTTEVVYAWKPFQSRDYLLRNVVGNWQFAPVYTYQSAEFFTPQSGVDSNLNGDAVDRTFINPNGVRGTGSGTTALVSNGQTVGYYTNVAAGQNPNAYYIQAGPGALPTGHRNTEPIRPTNNFDLSAVKRFQLYERFGFEFGAQALNVLNHPQFTGGNISTINTPSTAGDSGFVQVNNSRFNRPEQSFSSNSRFLQLDVKCTF
jgi:hypothetical protein